MSVDVWGVPMMRTSQTFVECTMWAIPVSSKFQHDAQPNHLAVYHYHGCQYTQLLSYPRACSYALSKTITHLALSKPIKSFCCLIPSLTYSWRPSCKSFIPTVPLLFCLLVSPRFFLYLKPHLCL